MSGREVADWSKAELSHLKTAMDWVIPSDTTPGAGSDAGLARLLELIDSLNLLTVYADQLPGLTEPDLGDTSNEFAAMFINHVRDVYYAYPESGSWADIGFEVTG